MPTRSQAAKAASQEVPEEEEQPAPQQVLDQPLRPDARVMREMAQNFHFESGGPHSCIRGKGRMD